MSKTESGHWESVPALQYEDYDDCLTAARRDCAERHGLELWEVTARWGSDERDSIRLEWSDRT